LPKEYSRLKTIFFGSTGTLHAHISRSVDHYDAYIAHCNANDIAIDEAAAPKDARLRKEAIFNAAQYVKMKFRPICPLRNHSRSLHRNSQQLITSYGAPIAHRSAWTQDRLMELTINFIVENDLVCF
jgi:hypothetical protein